MFYLQKLHNVDEGGAISYSRLHSREKTGKDLEFVVSISGKSAKVSNGVDCRP